MNRLKLISNYLQVFEIAALRVSQIEKLHDPDAQFGIISARRSTEADDTRRPSAENDRQHSQLLLDIQSLGLPYESAEGFWSENSDIGYAQEDSILVQGISFGELYALAEKYEQEAIIFKGQGESGILYDMTDNTEAPIIAMEINPNTKRLRKTPITEEDKELERVRTELREDPILDPGMVMPQEESPLPEGPYTQFGETQLIYELGDSVPSTRA